MTEPPETGWIKELVGWVLSGIFAFALGVMTLVGRYSKMALNRARDSDDVSMIAQKNARISKLENDLDTVYAERNAALSQIGGLTAKVEYLGEQIAEFRREDRHRASEVAGALEVKTSTDVRSREQLARDLALNTDLTQEALTQAQKAYKEANAVNKKIESVGLMAKDGTQMNDYKDGD